MSKRVWVNGVLMPVYNFEHPNMDPKSLHVWHKCNCNKDQCSICVGDLGYCVVCGAAEVELTVDCPGRVLTEQELTSIARGELQFVYHRWYKFAKEKHPEYTPGKNDIEWDV